MLNFSGISVFYGDLQVLWDVSIEVREKEIVVLVAKNGEENLTKGSAKINLPKRF